VSFLLLKNRVFSTYLDSHTGIYQTTLNFNLEPVKEKTEVEGISLSGGSNTTLTIHLTSGTPSCVADFYISSFGSGEKYLSVSLHLYLNRPEFESLANFNTETHNSFFSFNAYKMLAAAGFDFQTKADPSATSAIPVSGFRIQINEKENPQISLASKDVPIARKAYAVSWLIVILLLLILLRL